MEATTFGDQWLVIRLRESGMEILVGCFGVGFIGN